MINLIPPQAKRELRKEYWFRVTAVWLFLWSIFLIVGVSILLPAYVLITSQIAVSEDSAIAASERVTHYENVSTTLINASKQAKFALDETSAPIFSDYIALFEKLEGKEIQINKIHVSRVVEGIAPISLAGMASGRQSLAAFRDRLLELEEVSEVDLPISNLAQDKDIPFTITVTLHNKNDV